MRIISRPDFDGIVCAALLSDALEITDPVLWVEPHDMQSKNVTVRSTDIIANLAYHENCALWFDHHESNRIAPPYNGVFAIAPSAARLIFNSFNNYDTQNDLFKLGNKIKPFSRDFSQLVAAADKIDSAQLTPDEVLHPGKYPYVAISMTIVSHYKKDLNYWVKLTELFQKHPVTHIFADPEVSERCAAIEERNYQYADTLKKYTTIINKISVTDFRPMETVPTGNRFLVFSIYPETVVNVKIRFHDINKKKVIVNIGHSIFNRNCHVNVGKLCARFGGGGHRGAGSFNAHVSNAEEYISIVKEVLNKNEKQ